MKNKKDEIDVLVDRFREETDKISLPSADDILQMIEKVDASEHHNAPFVPLSRRRRIGWRYVAAAVVVGLVAVSVALLLPGSPTVPQTASTDSVVTIVDTVRADSVAPALPSSTDVERGTRIATLPQTEGAAANSVAPQPETVTPSAASSMETERAGELMAADEKPLPDEPAAGHNDSVRAPADKQDGVEEYPERPTIKETENLIREENNTRALRNRKNKASKDDKSKKKHGFMNKSKDRKEDVNFVVPEAKPPTNHPIMQGGRIVNLYY